MRLLRRFVVLCALSTILPAQATVSVTSAFDGSSGPFLRTEMVIVAISGFQPFRPVTLFYGPPAAAPIPVPGTSGALAVDPLALQNFAGVDGLGLYGGYPARTDSGGGLVFSLLVPANFGAPAALPQGFLLQAIALESTTLGGPTARFSSPATFTIAEPPSSPVITGFVPRTIVEGSPTPIIVNGFGFLPEATVVPEVRFISICQPGIFGLGTNVRVLSATSLEVTPPPFLGAPTAPPSTASGQVLVSVRYSSTTLYPNNPAAGDVTTSPAGLNDPTLVVYQAPITPVVTDVSPHAGIVPAACPVSITGSGFLNCASVFFNGQPATNVIVVSSTQIICQPPATAGVSTVVVRNFDHLPTVPRESPVVPGVTDYVTFNPNALGISVTSITPNLTQEGSSVPITISGTCAVVGGYSVLDPRSGATSVNLGVRLQGIDTFVSLPVVSTTITAPGQWTIVATSPSLPPGLNPPGLTANGRSNTGAKSAQIVAPLCVNPTSAPHATFAAIPSLEPGNRIDYRASVVPTITGILPNNCGRVDGGQTITIVGTNFFTLDNVLPSSVPGLVPVVALSFPSLLVPLGPATILNDTTLQIVTPDLSGQLASLPQSATITVTTPDSQAAIPGSPASADFFFLPSLAPTSANPFALGPGTTDLDTGALGTPQVFTFTGDTVLPLGLLVRAAGDHPLIIRCRGNVTLDGTIDLSGSTISTGPYFRPAGAGRGGAGATLPTLGLQSAIAGLPGTSPFDPATSLPFLGFGLGGLHTDTDGYGGGGGASFLNGLDGLGTDLAAPTGGIAYGTPPVLLPLLGQGGGAEFLVPFGGSGGGAGGLGIEGPFDPTNPPLDGSKIGFGGSGGNGGGGVCIAADGVITINGALLASGAAGQGGSLAAATPRSGGAGGGGGGGTIALQAIQGIAIAGTAVLDARGAGGGSGGLPGFNDGGAGGDGRIRLAIPLQSANPGAALQIQGGASVLPAPETTGF